MTKRIFYSILITTLFVFGAALLLTMGVLYNHYESDHLDQMRIQTSAIARGVEENHLDYLKGLDVGDYRITWINKDGNVLFDNKKKHSKMANHLEREEIKEAFEKGYGQSERESDTLMERMVYCAKKLDDGTVIRVADSRYTVWRFLNSIMLPLLLIIAGAVVISLLLSRSFSKMITKPMKEGLHAAVDQKGYQELQPLIDESEKMRREFTANVSHELKTPLQSITGYAELMKNDMVAPDDIQPFAEKIYSESNRMTALINDIIDLSHLDEGGSDMEISTVDLYDIGADVVASLREDAASKQLTLDVTGEHVSVSGYSQLIWTMIHNLCDNSIKYSEPGGVITVGVAKEKGKAILTVADTGIGIPEEEQERIFERFYRVDKSRSRQVGGTGLGLSIVKHAAIMHDAAVKVESSPGKGTTISIIFKV